MAIGRLKKNQLKFQVLTDFQQKNTLFGQPFMYWLDKINCNKKRFFVDFLDDIISKIFAKLEQNCLLTFREIVSTV